MSCGDVDRFSSPKSKLLRFFQKSRNGWKAKHHELKKSCKLLQNQVRAVEKSRAAWREQALTLKRRLAEVAGELEELKSRRSTASGR
jgi:chromosome segregation ATPase